MQLIILIILLCYVFFPKNRFSDEIRIFGNPPKFITYLDINLSIRGFLTWKSRKKPTKLYLKQNCNGRTPLSQQSVALVETRNKSAFKSGASLASNMSNDFITNSYSPLKVTHFMCYGRLLNLKIKRDFQFSVFLGILTKTAFFQKIHKILSNNTRIPTLEISWKAYKTVFKAELQCSHTSQSTICCSGIDQK